VILTCDRFDPSTLMVNVRFSFSSQTGMGTLFAVTTGSYATT
jgi:hypothetical protein